MIHPGPDHIKPGAAPGGLVVHIYDTRDAALLTFHPLPCHAYDDAIAADHAAEISRLIPDDVPVCLVFFDGDNGLRMTPRWAGPA